MRKTILLILTYLFLILQHTKVTAQPGALDLGFGNGGLVSTFVASNNAKPNCSAIQTDGKILVAGYTYYDTINYKTGFALVRYNTDGTLDTTFNSTGKVVTIFNGSTSSVAYAIALQPDNKIILTGFATIGSGNKMAMVRYLTNGNIDSTFGINGFVATAISTKDDRATSILLQSDGKLVVGGISKNALNKYDFAIARFDSIGVLDSTFSDDGINSTSFSGNEATSNSVAMNQDSTYYLFGSVTNITTLYFAMARYLQNGNIDSSFGTNGTNSYAPGNGFKNAGAKVLIQPDKKLLLYGNADFNGLAKLVIIRLDSTASMVDPNFGTNGKAIVGFTTHPYGASGIALQLDGKIVTAGTINNSSSDDFALVRFKSDGAPDSTFGTNGIVITSFGSNDDNSCSINIQPDEKIVVAGKTENPNTYENHFALARYFGDLNVSSTEINTSPHEISIFPNPLTHELNIVLTNDELTEITLYDIGSRKCLHQEFTNSIKLNTEQLSKGIYFYQLRNLKGISYNGKVIKQ